MEARASAAMGHARVEGGIAASHNIGSYESQILGSSQGDLPAKSSQYGLLGPTKLDKIDNLRFEVQHGALDLCQTNLIYLNEEW